MNCLNDHHRILLIDQNPTKQTLRANILRNYEIEVHTASSVTDAAFLWRRHLYDLVLLAAQENSEEAGTVSAQIRKINPRQRIGLLVGPPVFVLELGGKREPRREPRRRKVARIHQLSPNRVAEDPGNAVAAQPSAPHWQETIRRLVTDWYADSSALLGWSRLAGRTAGA
jgi:CheY-like chemotaxis protein